MILPRNLQAFADKRNAVVIGTNNVWNVLSGFPLKADHVVMLDKDFWMKGWKNWLGYSGCFQDCVPVLGFEPNPPPKSFIPIKIELQRLASASPAYERGRYFHGMSSGCAAIQFALHAGVTEIFLLGHDLRVAEGKTHGNGVRTNHELVQNYPQGRGMIQGYQVAYEHAQKLGVNMVNLSPVSALTFIPHGDVANGS